jgi:phosphate ABC transporter phosphate-binding protein
MTAENPPAGTESPKPARPLVTRRPRRAGWVALIVVVVVVVVVLAVGYQQKWFSSSSSAALGSCPTGITLQGDGAQFVAPLMTVWTAAFASFTGNQVNYPASGSGTGLTHFSESPPLIDFAITDEPLSSAQRAAMPAQPLTIPIIGGALAIIYNLPGVPGHLNLTGAILAEVYNGNITTWNDPAIRSINPGVNLPSNAIITVHRADPAGTTYVLTDLLSQDSAYWATHIGKGISVDFPPLPGAIAANGNSLVLRTVATTSYAIGYSDLTDVLTYTKSVVQYAAIGNPAGHYVVPTLANTASAIADKVASTGTFPTSTGNWYNVSMVNAGGTADYPLATFVYLFVYQNTGNGYDPSLTKSQVIVQWLDWALSTGQTLANETSPSQLYYTALPASILTIDATGIQTMTYNGALIPACK